MSRKAHYRIPPTLALDSLSHMSAGPYFPRYRSPGEAVLTRNGILYLPQRHAVDTACRAECAAARRLGDRHQRGARQRDPDLTAHDVEQQTHAAVAVEALQEPDLLGEGAGQDANLLPHGQAATPIEAQDIAAVGQGDQRLDDAARRRLWPVATHHYQARDAEGAVDAAPAIAVEVENDEEITRKDRRQNIFHFARMATSLEAAWQEGAKALILELLLRARLAVRQAMDREPARPPGARRVQFPQGVRIRSHRSILPVFIFRSRAPRWCECEVAVGFETNTISKSRKL